MRIALFTDTYEPQVNGVVTSINRFTKELRRRGHIVYIFSPSSPGFQSKRFIRTFKSIAFRNYPEYKIGIPLLDEFFKKRKFDIVHVHTPATVGLCGVLLAKYYGLPLVGTYHTLLSEYSYYLIKKSKNLKKITKRALWKYTSLFYNRCDRVIVPSEEIRKELKKHGVRREIAVIPTGIEIEKRKPVRHRGKAILHVGRLSKEKNVQFIIKSLRNILKEDVKLVVASDGPYKNELMKLTKKLGIKNITFTGYLSQKELEKLYSKSDLFVMASKSETQGIVLAEAMAFSLPIVIIDSPVTGNFVRKNKIGLVVKERNFAKGVKKMLYNDNFRRRFTKKLSVKEYDIKNCTDKLIEVYSELL